MAYEVWSPDNRELMGALKDNNENESPIKITNKSEKTIHERTPQQTTNTGSFPPESPWCWKNLNALLTPRAKSPTLLNNKNKSSISSSSPLTVLGEKDIRESIRNLPPAERAKKLHEIMQRNSRKMLLATSKFPQWQAGIALEVAAPVTSFHNVAEGVFGCAHYEVNVKLSAPCCNKFYACRFCHNESESHTLDRRSVTRIFCMRCCNVQNVTGARESDERCNKCFSAFSRYFCSECRFYDNSANKQIFHCEKCGSCKVGRKEDFFHCDKCNVCLAVELKDKHKCVERCLEAYCPICAETMNDSLEPSSLLQCGHALHVKCLEKHREKMYTCPTCGKSMGDTKALFKTFQEAVDRYNQSMPSEYQDVRAQIYCVDCEKKSSVKYHFLYHKCTHCNSFNTKILAKTRAKEKT